MTKVPAHVFPRMRSPSVAGSGSAAATTSRGATSTPRTRTGSVRSSPSLCSVSQHVDELLAEAVLERDAAALDPARHEQHLLVLDVDALDGADPLREVEHLGLANGSVVYQPRSRSQITGGLRHSSIVVQIEKVGAKSYPSTTRSAPSRTATSSTSAKSSSAACRANTSESPGSTPMPTSASWPASSHDAACANCRSPSFSPVS